MKTDNEEIRRQYKKETGKDSALPKNDPEDTREMDPKEIIFALLCLLIALAVYWFTT